MHTQEEFNSAADGLEKAYLEMMLKMERAAPMCHFRKMFPNESDSVDGYADTWWECSVCGHTQDR